MIYETCDEGLTLAYPRDEIAPEYEVVEPDDTVMAKPAAEPQPDERPVLFIVAP